MKKLALIALACAAIDSSALGATRKPIVLSNGQMEQIQAGDTIQAGASSASSASINLPHGTSPTAPNNGDIWTTTAGMFVQINGVTYGPIASYQVAQPYTGTYSTQVNQFGGRSLVTAPGGTNAIVGAAVQDGSNGYSFPTGATGYGINVASGTYSGNQAFGAFGRCDLGAHLTVTGVTGECSNEFNVFNYSGPPDPSLPQALNFGTTTINANAGQFVCYGDYSCSIGSAVLLGDHPFLTGYYVAPGAASSYGIMIDASSSLGAAHPAVFKGTASVIPVAVQTLGTMVPQGAMSTWSDNGSVVRAAVKQIGDYYGRAWASTGQSVPTIAGSGAGTGATYALETGSNDGAGTVIITAGSGATSAGGTIALTFSSAIGGTSSACLLTAATNFLSNSSLVITAQSASAVSFAYLDGGGTGTALTSGTAYRANYFCPGH